MSDAAAEAAKRVLAAKVVNVDVGRRALILRAALKTLSGNDPDRVVGLVIRLRYDKRRAVAVLENFRNKVRA